MTHNATAPAQENPANATEQVGSVAAEPPLAVSFDQQIAWLTLNRPNQYNALSESLLAALHAAVDRVAVDANIRVVVIAGAGKAFCAGHDLREMQQDPSPDRINRLFKTCGDLMLKLNRLPQPVIAEVNGMATAAGCQLVAQADLAIAADHAKFAVSGINLGLFCSTPAVPLSRAIPRKRAAELLFTGDFIDAATARELGLVNQVVPAANLRSATLALAEKLKAKPRASLASGKALFYRQLDVGLEAAYADAANTIACNFLEPAAQEGVQAFLEKRPPRWPD